MTRYHESPFEIRHLRSIVAVLDELNFSRAAAELHVSQSTLSERIGQLERLLGIQLLVRRNRGVNATEAGRLFGEHAREILAAVDSASSAMQRVTRGQLGTLQLGVQGAAGGEVAVTLLREFGARVPEVDVKLNRFGWDDPYCGLIDGRANASFVGLFVIRLQEDSEQIDAITLLEEPAVYVIGKTHPLASSPFLTIDDVEDQPFFAVGSPDANVVASGIWSRNWLELLGSPIVPQRVVGTVGSAEELNHLIASGEGIALRAASAESYFRHPGVAYIPALGLRSMPSGLAWNKNHITPPLERLIEIARTLAPIQTTTASEHLSS